MLRKLLSQEWFWHRDNWVWRVDEWSRISPIVPIVTLPIIWLVIYVSFLQFGVQIAMKDFVTTFVSVGVPTTALAVFQRRRKQIERRADTNDLPG